MKGLMMMMMMMMMMLLLFVQYPPIIGDIVHFRACGIAIFESVVDIFC